MEQYRFKHNREFQHSLHPQSPFVPNPMTLLMLLVKGKWYHATKWSTFPLGCFLKRPVHKEETASQGVSTYCIRGRGAPWNLILPNGGEEAGALGPTGNPPTENLDSTHKVGHTGFGGGGGGGSGDPHPPTHLEAPMRSRCNTPQWIYPSHVTHQMADPHNSHRLHPPLDPSPNSVNRTGG